MRSGYFTALAVAVLLGSGMLVFAKPPAGSGSITGKVTYTGTPPKMKPIDMSKEPSCAKQHATPVMTQNVTTGPGNALQWVVVYISAGDEGSSAPSQGARYDQKGCEYLPHVLPMQVAQQLQTIFTRFRKPTPSGTSLSRLARHRLIQSMTRPSSSR
jgi:hypothetical protein